ncbi:tyrosine-type recombinase/integrase [Sphaerisporangium album]|nr:site-specific integrase [Sphaerisporangium album]
MTKVHSERAKGHIESLPSGSFRVKVYAGLDPTTGKERRYRKTVKTEVEALETLAKLLRDVEAEREPQEAATLDYVLTRYLEVADLEVSTREAHEGYIRRTIRPVLGDVRIGKLRADMLDSLYTHLKRCSRLCNRLPKVEHCTEAEHVCNALCVPLKDHRTPRPHQCDQRCTPHKCKPMAAGSILRIHAIISAALNLAVRYDWIDRNVAEKATPPQPKKREPDPPTPKQAARLLNELWEADPEFALFVWLATTTGARRGELVGLRRHRIDFEAQEIRITRNYLVKAGQQIEKDTKTGEGRRLSLDPLTCELLQEHLRRRETALNEAGVESTEDAFVFSPDPAGLRPWNPDTITHKYERYARATGIRSSLKELRHYSATQLLSNGIDLRTAAGRLGHSGGGVTTLRFYAQFTRPADKQAAAMLSSQLEDLRKRERL